MKKHKPFEVPVCPTCGLPRTHVTVSSRVHVAVVVYPRGHEVLAVSPSRQLAGDAVHQYALRCWPTSKEERAVGRAPIPEKPPEGKEEAIALYFAWCPDRESYSITEHSYFLLKSGRAEGGPADSDAVASPG